MHRTVLTLIAAAALLWAPIDLCAHHWEYPSNVQGKVTLLEPSNVGAFSGGAIFFMVDVSAPTCPAGTWLFWNPRVFGGNPVTDPIEAQRELANTRAILSTLQLALAMDKKVTLHGYQMVQAGYCQISAVWLSP